MFGGDLSADFRPCLNAARDLGVWVRARLGAGLFWVFGCGLVSEVPWNLARSHPISPRFWCKHTSKVRVSNICTIVLV